MVLRTKFIFNEIVVCLFSLLFILGCSGPTHTDIDYIFETYAKDTDTFAYVRNCKKPKAFRGINKFRVSCLKSLENEAWEDSFSKSHSGIFYTIGARGFRHVGSTETPKL